ncbi:ankyrin repeat protein [Colletotrichum chrysophilum]|uniref:Ankyrin repeat protein n=1 Tax=Colletotrichum chrysophilum TaxID=1836956 RepID=A0AAD9AAX2_9PEZI|nr:ankyrin repeat protein [Colletotrichum chrysophilum]
MGADVDVIRGEKRLTPLHIAAENCCEKVVALLLDHNASVKSRSSSGSTPFYRAARGGSVNILRLLHEKNSELDDKTFDSWTPLMAAIENNCQEAAKLLLEWGADPKATSDQGITPLLLCEAWPHLHGLTPYILNAIDAKGLEADMPLFVHRAPSPDMLTESDGGGFLRCDLMMSNPDLIVPSSTRQNSASWRQRISRSFAQTHNG